MKAKYILFLVLFTAGLFTACSEESLINGPDNPNPPLPEGHALVQFSLKGIGGSVRSYAEITPDKDSLECQIDSVMIYVFNNDLNTTIEPDENAKLENITKVKVEIGTNNSKDEFLASTTFTNTGSKWFVVIANGKDTTSIREGMVYSQFKKQCTPDLNVLPTTPFFMSGMDHGTLSNSTPANVSIELTRAVTRIDISIRNTADGGATNPFVLKEVRISNVNNKGYLLWNTNGSGSFLEPESQRITTPWVDVESKVLKSSKTDSLWHYLYTYETLAKTDKQVALEIKGYYNGQLSIYKIPLTRDENTSVTPNIPLRNLVRNHRYLVYIDSIAYTDITGEVVISDWEFTERDTIAYNPEVSFGSPVVTIQDETKYRIEPGELIGNLKVDTIIVERNGYTGRDVMIVNLTSYNIRSVFHSSVDWITAEEVEVSSYAVGSDTVEIKQRFKVTIDEAPTSSNIREGVFEFHNPLLKNNKSRYVVKQRGYTYSDTPLAKWAKGNLVTVGSTNWTELTATNAGTQSAAVYGSTFQWGRNVAFAATTTASISASNTTAIASNNTSTTSFIGNMQWHTGSTSASDTWLTLGGYTKAKDVCPTGWHIPTTAELLQIVPSNNSSWIGDGFATGMHLIIGDYAVRWKWVAGTSGYMEVKMLPALAYSITTSNINGHVLWDEAEVETRYFPAVGWRSYSSGNVSSVGSSGWYWVRDGAPNCLMFSATSAYQRTDGRSYGFPVRCIAD